MGEYTAFDVIFFVFILATYEVEIEELQKVLFALFTNFITTTGIQN